MKNILALTIFLALTLSVVWPAHARDTKYLLPIAAALEAKDAKTRLDGSVKFYFGNQETPPVAAKLGTDVTNLKTNAVGKSDERACNWVFLSAMLALEKRAKQLGANAVISMRFDSSELAGTMSEIVAYGTAVLVAPDAGAAQPLE